MNSYEHTFITKQDLSDSQAKKLVDKYEDIIKANSGKVLKIEEWGLKNLSHKIRARVLTFFLFPKKKKHYFIWVILQRTSLHSTS